MEYVIAKLVQDFEQGRLTRRQLIRTLALTSAASAVNPAEAADPALKAAGIHHISYQVADYARTRDFYAGLLGTKISEDDGKQQCVLTLGTVRIILRNGLAGRTPVVDHIAYSFENWNQEAVLAGLKTRGLKPEPEGERSFQLKDPDGYHVQLSARR